MDEVTFKCRQNQVHSRPWRNFSRRPFLKENINTNVLVTFSALVVSKMMLFQTTLIVCQVQ